MNSILISGPAKLDILKYNNMIFFLFGDQHDSASTGSCNDIYKNRYGIDLTCDSLNYDYRGTSTTTSYCWSIGALLDEWLTYNNDNGIVTDFYVETTFTKSGIRNFNSTIHQLEKRRENIYKNNGVHQDSLDPLNKQWLVGLSMFFDDCLKPNKFNCKYGPYVHIHNMDTRKGFYSQRLKYEMHSSDILYFSIDVDFIYYLSLLKIDVINSHGENLFFKHLDEINKDLEDFVNVTDGLLTNAEILAETLYFGKEPLDVILQKLNLYITEISTRPLILKTFLNKLDHVKLSAVKRDGKLLTRTATEFLRLAKIDPSIAAKIKDFALKEIRSLVDMHFSNDISLLKIQDFTDTIMKSTFFMIWMQKQKRSPLI